MRSFPVLTALASVLALASATPVKRQDPDCDLPFNFTRLFDASINLRIDHAQTPITVTGGVLINEPIIGGIISGPAINGTVSGGFAHPSIINKGATQLPVIDIYGVTDDGQPYYIHATGIGETTRQVARIEISINGTRYADLENDYILASITPNANRTVVAVKGYSVQNTA